jgi:hypothetical protein
VVADLGADDADGGFVERCCKMCEETFEIELKRGGQRKYCYGCEPPNMSVVYLPSGRAKLRRRKPVVKRADLELMWGRKPPAA